MLARSMHRFGRALFVLIFLGTSYCTAPPKKLAGPLDPNAPTSFSDLTTPSQIGKAALTAYHIVDSDTDETWDHTSSSFIYEDRFPTNGASGSSAIMLEVELSGSFIILFREVGTTAWHSPVGSCSTGPCMRNETQATLGTSTVFIYSLFNLTKTQFDVRVTAQSATNPVPPSGSIRSTSVDGIGLYTYFDESSDFLVGHPQVVVAFLFAAASNTDPATTPSALVVPFDNSAVAVSVQMPDGTALPVLMQLQSPGAAVWYGNFVPNTAGTYTVIASFGAQISLMSTQWPGVAVELTNMPGMSCMVLSALPPLRSVALGRDDPSDADYFQFTLSFDTTNSSSSTFGDTIDLALPAVSFVGKAVLVVAEVYDNSTSPETPVCWIAMGTTVAGDGTVSVYLHKQWAVESYTASSSIVLRNVRVHCLVYRIALAAAPLILITWPAPINLNALRNPRLRSQDTLDGRTRFGAAMPEDLREAMRRGNLPPIATARRRRLLYARDLLIRTVLVHDYCVPSAASQWNLAHFRSPLVFDDPYAARENSVFADRVATFLEANIPYASGQRCAIIAHGQGGNAVAYMHALKFTCLDNNPKQSRLFLINPPFPGTDAGTFSSLYAMYKMSACPAGGVFDLLSPNGATFLSTLQNVFAPSDRDHIEVKFTYAPSPLKSQQCNPAVADTFVNPSSNAVQKNDGLVDYQAVSALGTKYVTDQIAGWCHTGSMANPGINLSFVLSDAAWNTNTDFSATAFGLESTAAAGQCVSVEGGSSADNTKLKLDACNAVDSQRFRALTSPSGGESLNLVPLVAISKFLTVQSGAADSFMVIGAEGTLARFSVDQVSSSTQSLRLSSNLAMCVVPIANVYLKTVAVATPTTACPVRFKLRWDF